MQINIVNVGLGNISSIKNWLFSNNCSFNEIKKPEEWKSGPIIIPGVSMSNILISRLKKKEFDQLFKMIKKKGVGILAICSGFQSLSNYTDEGSGAIGLKHFPGKTVILNNKNKFQIGWDYVNLEFHHRNKIIKIKKKFFFNHGFAIKITKSQLLKYDQYSLFNGNFLSFAQYGSFIGTQFHPEKSKDSGNILLRYLIAI